MISGEHHKRWRLLPSVGNALNISFAFPKRGGDANVYNFGRIDLACKLDYCFVNIRGAHK